MKRFLTIAALCLLGSLPAKAIVLHSGESVTVGGEFSSYAPDNLVTFTMRVEMDDPRHYYPYPQFIVGWNAGASASTSTNGASIYTCGGSAPGPGGCYSGYPTQKFLWLSEDDPVITVATYFSGWQVFPSSGTQDPPFGVPANAIVTVDLELSNPNLFFITPVPEPATWAMMLLGFAALGGLLQLKNAQRRIEIDRERLACR
jgi:hypothetical protein